jgi:release factor glutamine methyltransferase
MRLSEWLDKGEAVLRAGPHPEKARRDAEVLLQHLLRKNKAWLLAHGDHEISASASEENVRLLDRRLKGEPIQYLFREIEFFGLTLAVTPKVLIPRPETEHLVEKAIELSFSYTKPRILDVGTGSGAIAIAIAHDCSRSAAITATDLSRPALKIARFNARRTGFANQIRFLQGDLLEPVAGEQFDLVVSNPPYVPAADRESLAVEVREYEPGLALFAGGDGLDVYRRLIPAAFAVLAPGGFIALEIGYGQSDAVRSLLASTGFVEVRFAPDLQGIERVALAQRP